MTEIYPLPALEARSSTLRVSRAALPLRTLRESPCLTLASLPVPAQQSLLLLARLNTIVTSACLYTSSPQFLSSPF